MPNSQKRDYIVGAYYSNWSVYEAEHFPRDLSYHFTHIFYAFLKPNSKTGHLEHIDKWADLEKPIGELTGAIAALMLLKKVRPNLKVILSIGGWGTHKEFQSMALDSDRVANFIQSTVAFLQKHGFDGVDIDWEYPLNAREGAQLLSLLTVLRLKLDPKLSLSVAAPAGSEQVNQLNIPAMDRVLSFWNIMCYDFVGSSWSERAGYHSNLYGNNGSNALNAHLVLCNYAERGATPKKLVMGMPAYGRAFSKLTSHHIGAKFRSKEDILIDVKDIDRSNQVFDSSRVAAASYIPDKDILVTYDNAQCAIIKGRYVKEHELAGGFWWDSKGEGPNYNLVDCFVLELQDQSTQVSNKK